MKMGKTTTRKYEGDKKQLGVRMPREMVRILDTFIDGIKYQTRSHLVFTILVDWLKTQGVDIIEILEKQKDKKKAHF